MVNDKGDIRNYEHPFVAFDGVVLRCQKEHLEVLLVQRTEPPEAGKWSLPGGFMDIDRRLDETLLSKVSEKTGVTGYYMEQLKTYDAIDRDSRGRILSVAYLALTNDIHGCGDWFQMNGNKLSYGETALDRADLAFDHGDILRDAVERLAGKLWYSELARHLLPEEFTIREAWALFDAIEQKGHSITNFKRDIKNRIIETGNVRVYAEGRGRPAALYRWKEGG